MNSTVEMNKKRLPVFLLCVAVFMVLLFLRDFAGKGIPAILFLCLTAFVALFADKTEIVAFCFCFIPILNAFQSKYAFMICIAVYIARFVRIKSVAPYTLPIAFLVAWEILHGFTSELSLVLVLRVFAELVFCCFVLSLSREEIDFKKIVRTMSCVAVCAYTILLLAQLRQFDYQISALFSGVFRFGNAVDETKMAVGFNPNYLAYICMCCIEGLGILVYKKQSNVVDVICLGTLGVFGLLTMSRKFIVCAAVWFILFLLSYKQKTRIFVTMLIVLLAVAFIVQAVFPTAAEALLHRFSDEDLDGGRDDIFLFFNNLLSDDMGVLFFGVGLQNLGNKMSERYNSTIPHNGFQELLVIWGIPGLIAFVLFLNMIIGRAKKLNPDIKLINYTPVFVMLLNVLVSQMASSNVVISCMAIVYICLVVDPCQDGAPAKAGNALQA